MRLGLKLLGVDKERQRRQSKKSNLADFKAHYCVAPIVCAQMWEDLQTTTIQDARVFAASPQNRNSGANLKNFLRAFHFLMRYGTEQERKVATGQARNTVRKWNWFFVEKIGALHGLKVIFHSFCSVPVARFSLPTAVVYFDTAAYYLRLQIVWPQNWSTNFIISVDGVHCRIPEPKHPFLSKDPAFYSQRRL